jgi:outer membrane protein insertion porin family
MTRITALLLLLLAGHTMAERVGLSGMKTMSRSDIRVILGDRLENIEAKPPTPARAEDAAFLLERLLRLQGYAHATVRGAVEGSRIRLFIEEGQRQFFGKILIEGVDDRDRKSMEKLFTSTADRRQMLFAPRIPFLEEDIESGIEFITQEWQARGYWAVKIDSPTRTPHDNGDVDFHVKIHRGARHVIAPVKTQGRLHQGDFLRRILTRYQGIPATSANINEIRRKVIAFYRKRGFADATVLLSGEPRDDQFHILLSVELGTRYQLRQWNILGLKKTLPHRIERRFEGTEGKYYDANHADRTVRKLLGTGAFSSIVLETEKMDATQQLDATLHITEGQAKSFGAYAGMETFEGAIVGTSYADRNLWGRLLQLNAGLEWSQRGILFDSKIVDPFFLDTDVQAGYRYFAVNRDLDVYQKLETGFSLDFTWQKTEFDSLLLFLASSQVEISRALADPSRLGATSYNHNRARLTWTRDHLNNKVNPTSGWLTKVSGELGAVIGSDHTSYVSSEAQLSYYLPVDEIHHIGLGLRGGFITSATGASLPIDLRYFLGGPASVRSFRVRELGPRDANDQPIGGEAWWVANTEYVHSLSGPVKAVAFLDVGTLSEKAADLGVSSIDVALGLGLRVDLPIGPIRVEYGHNLTQDANERSGALFFAIGVAF